MMILSLLMISQDLDLKKNDNVIDYDDNDEDDDSITNFKFKADDNLLYNKKN